MRPQARCSVLSLMLIGARHLISNGSPHLQESFKALGDHVNQTKLELMRSQMAVFKESLEQFALKYRWEGWHCAGFSTILIPGLII